MRKSGALFSVLISPSLMVVPMDGGVRFGAL